MSEQNNESSSADRTRRTTDLPVREIPPNTEDKKTDQRNSSDTHGGKDIPTLPPEAASGEESADLSPIPLSDWNDSETLTKVGDPPASAPASMPEVPGYEILAELGRGGMGVVYQARHLQLDRIVALKMILAGEHAGEDALARFRIEAEAVARLQHPNIVQIHDVGEHQGLPYFSLEFCSGGSLDRKLRDGSVSPEEAAALVEKLARAMQVAHDSYVIHRDLKPANVLITSDGTPKITDFGLAKKLDEVRRTRTNAIMGTPSYMAPEQASDRKVTIGPAADVYALGAILYELLTGRPPFLAATSMETILQMLSEDAVPLRRHNPKVPIDLETICLKCLAKEPEQRYDSAEELANDLQRYQQREPIVARPVSRLERIGKWVRRRPTLAGLLAMTLSLLVLLPLGAISLIQKQESDRQRDEARRQKAEVEKQKHKAEILRHAAEARRAEALFQKDKANRERQRAETSEATAERLRYGNQMNYAFQLWKEGDVRLAWDVLQQTKLQFRGWEYGYVATLFNPATLEGYPTVMHSVAFSPDGKHIVSGGIGGSGSLKVWDSTTGAEKLTLKGHAGLVTSVAFSPDGTRIVSGSGDNTLKVWDSTTGTEKLTLKGHTSSVTSVAFSPDGTRIVSGSGDNTLKVWDSTTGGETLTLKGHGSSVYGVAISPDGNRIVSGSFDTTVKVWDSTTGAEKLTLKGHTSPVTCVAFSPDGTRIMSGSGDNTLKVWDSTTGAEKLTLKGHTSPVACVAFSPDGARIVSGSGDNTLKVWDSTTGAEKLTLKGHTSSVTCVAFSPDSKRIVSGSIDTTVKVWDSSTKNKVSLILRGHSNSVDSVAFSPDGNQIVSGSGDNTVKVWDSSTGEETLTLKGHTSSVTCVAFSPDGKRIVSGSWDDTVKVWDSTTGEETLTLKGHTSSVTCVAFSPDGKCIVSGSLDKTLKVWDCTTGEEIHTLKRHDNYVYSAAFSPDGKRIVSGSWDDTVKVWDSTTGEEKLTLKGHTSSVTCVAFSPDGTRIVSGSGDNILKVWDSTTGAETLTLKGHSSSVYGVAFSPDGTRIVSGSGDNTLRVWEGTTGQETLKIVDIANDQQNLKEALSRLLPTADWHGKQAHEFEKSRQWYAVAFHRKRQFMMQPWRLDVLGQWTNTLAHLYEQEAERQRRNRQMPLAQN